MTSKLLSPELREQARAMIKGFPQGEILLSNPDRVDLWLDEVWAADPERFKWHVQRLGSLGGSDLGPCVAEFTGGRDSFTTRRQIVESKLMLRAPEAGTAAMLIGTAMEPYAHKEFMARYGSIGAVVAEDVLAKVSSGNPVNRIRPWIPAKPNPDNVIRLDGKVVIVDYKVTISESQAAAYLAGEVPQRYVDQLHLYALAMRQYGIKVDGLMLAPYLVNEDRLELAPIPVKLDNAHIDLIVEAGDETWRYVMRDKLPPWPEPRKSDILPDRVAEVNRLARELAIALALSSVAGKHASDLKESMKNLLSEAMQGDGSFRPAGGILNCNVSRSIDMVKARELLGDAAFQQAMRPAGMDPDLARKFLVAMGLDPETDPRLCRMEPNEKEVLRLLAERDIPAQEVNRLSHRISLATRDPAVTKLMQLATNTVGDFRFDAVDVVPLPDPAVKPKTSLRRDVVVGDIGLNS